MGWETLGILDAHIQLHVPQCLTSSALLCALVYDCKDVCLWGGNRLMSGRNGLEDPNHHGPGDIDHLPTYSAHMKTTELGALGP